MIGHLAHRGFPGDPGRARAIVISYGRPPGLGRGDGAAAGRPLPSLEEQLLHSADRADSGPRRVRGPKAPKAQKACSAWGGVSFRPPPRSWIEGTGRKCICVPPPPEVPPYSVGGFNLVNCRRQWFPNFPPPPPLLSGDRQGCDEKEDPRQDFDSMNCCGVMMPTDY